MAEPEIPQRDALTFDELAEELEQIMGLIGQLIADNPNRVDHTLEILMDFLSNYKRPQV